MLTVRQAILNRVLAKPCFRGHLNTSRNTPYNIFTDNSQRTYSILNQRESIRKFSNMSTTNSGTKLTAANDLSDLRKPYRDQDDGLEEDKLQSKDPFELFGCWFEMIKGSVYEPNAFCISTASKSGKPSSRMVLLKGYDKDGFRFFTHYSSQKGRNIDENPNVAMLFYWDAVNRQVRIEGTAKRLPEEVAEAYFKRRPLASQIGAAISDQCSLVESREALMHKYTSLEKQVAESNQPPEKPKTWGGYLIIPERFEFWQGNTNRVHDRIIFRRDTDQSEQQTWIMERMLP